MPFVIFPLPKDPILTSAQVERIANILDNAGQVVLGVMVISPLVQEKIDTLDPSVVILGSIGVLLCWTSSIRIAKFKDT